MEKKKRKSRKKSRAQRDEDYLANVLREQSILCECTNRIPFSAFDKNGVAVCNWCYRTHYLTKKHEFMNKFRNARRKVDGKAKQE